MSITITIYEQFHVTATKYASKTAVRFENKAYSYKKVDELIEITAQKLFRIGVKKGDVITVALPNCPTAVFLFYAINKLGAISYNVQPLTPGDGIAKMMKFVSSHYLFALDPVSESASPFLDNEVKIIGVNPYDEASPLKRIAFRLKYGHKDKRIIAFSHVRPLPYVTGTQTEESDDAVYLNTGGTGGEPKVVRLSNKAINHVGANSYQLIGGPYQSIRILTAIPLFHIFGLEMGLHTPLSFGGVSVLMLRFKTKRAIKHIRRADSTVILGVPSLYNALLSRDAFYGEHLKKQITAFIGGDYVPDSLLKRWNEAMERYGSEARLYQGYGLTEAGVAIVSTKGRDKKGSIGTPLPGIEVKILDPDSHKEVEDGSLGEIAIGGPSLMNGYYHDDERNQKELITIDGERFFLTKDYGYRDKDGYGYFKQRMKRVVKINGETLCPSEIEDAVLALDDVFDAYCYSVPDKRKGAAFRLLVTKREGDHAKKEEEVRALILEKIDSSLPPSYLPEKIFFVEKLPRTPLGKINIQEIEKTKEFFA